MLSVVLCCVVLCCESFDAKPGIKQYTGIKIYDSIPATATDVPL